MHRFKKMYIFLFGVYKMVDISAKNFAKNGIHAIKQLKKEKNQFYG